MKKILRVLPVVFLMTAFVAFKTDKGPFTPPYFNGDTFTPPYSVGPFTFTPPY